MDKASKAIRRSGVRLKSLSSGHPDLNMVISELKDVRQAAKAFMQAQNTAAQDMLKWSVRDENRAIQDIVSQLAELNSLWTEVQKEFTEQLKDYKYHFDMILEGERHVDQARNHLSMCEQREMKFKKELKKAVKKATREEVNHLEVKLGQAERAKDLAQLEVLDRIRENEILKMTRFKEGLLKVSDAYVELANKCAIIFEAQHDISHQLPTVESRDLQEIKYTGSGATKQSVIKAKDKVRQYRRHAYHLIPRLPPPTPLVDPPPPYTPSYYHNIRLAESSQFDIDASYNNNLTAGRNAYNHQDLDNQNFHSFPTRQRAVPSPLNARRQQDEVRWSVVDYEDDLSGAMGGANI